MMKREAQFGLLVRAWLRANPMYTCALELKQTTGSSIPFSDVAQAQLDYARAIQSDHGVCIRVVGFNGEPDYIYLRQQPVFFVIRFPHCFMLILSDIFESEKSISKRKSLTEKRAKEIATIVVELHSKRSRSPRASGSAARR